MPRFVLLPGGGLKFDDAMPEECASGTDALTQPGPDYVLDLLWPSTRVEY